VRARDEFRYNRIQSRIQSICTKTRPYALDDWPRLLANSVRGCVIFFLLLRMLSTQSCELNLRKNKSTTEDVARVLSPRQREKGIPTDREETRHPHVRLPENESRDDIRAGRTESSRCRVLGPPSASRWWW